jgi:hypothetical protein
LYHHPSEKKGLSQLSTDCLNDPLPEGLVEAAKAFDRADCKALDIAPKAEPPTLLTHPRVVD